MTASIHIHPAITSNPRAIAALQQRTGYSAVINLRGQALLMHSPRTSIHDAHVKAYQLARLDAFLIVQRMRRAQLPPRQPALYTHTDPNGAA